MKRLLILAPIFLLLLSPALKAQTVTNSDINSSVSTVRGVGNDLKKKKYRTAAGRVLDNKQVKKRVNVNDRVKNTVLEPNMKAKIKSAKADFRRNPLTFAQKHETEYRLLRKMRPKWLKRNIARSKAKK